MKCLYTILFLFGLFIISPSVAQQLLDEQGNPIPINENSEYLSNQIIVQFKPSSILLPAGQYKSPTALVTSPQLVRELLNR
jgi:hypothetical protein